VDRRQIRHLIKAEETRMSWLPSLKTATPEEGFDLAIKLSRMAVKKTQPDDEVRDRLRPDYANDADSLTMASQVVATNFQTVARANKYWTDD
jgi:hypothetical protein